MRRAKTANIANTDPPGMPTASALNEVAMWVVAAVGRGRKALRRRAAGRRGVRVRHRFAVYPRGCVALMLCALLASCASARGPTRGDVLLDTVEPADAERHTLAAHEDFAGGVARAESLVLPDYPAELLATPRPPFALCIELIINEAGAVEAVTALPASARCDGAEDPVGQRLLGVTSEVVRGWRFTPAVVCTLPAHLPADGTCSGEGVEAQAIPLRRAYRMVFAQHGGGTVQLDDSEG